MNSNHQLIDRFDRAFQQRDWAAMNACYHPDIHFSDPVFTDLHGDEARAMWHMLCERGTDLQVVYRDIRADEGTVHAHWEATYTFSTTGRSVHNIVDATFKFQDGQIIRHEDVFDLWRWMRMALGATGTVLGWSPYLKNKVRTTAMRGLRASMERTPTNNDLA